MLRFQKGLSRVGLLAATFSVLLLALPAVSEEKHDEDHAHTESAERVPVTDVPAGEAVIEINGLVCSFCAFGVEKSVKKLPFLDKKRFSSGVEVDINKHQMRLALTENAELDYRRLTRSLRAGGYEPLDIYLRVRGVIAERDGTAVLAGPGVQYALEDEPALATPPTPASEPVELLLRIDGRALHEMEKGARVPAVRVRSYPS